MNITLEMLGFFVLLGVNLLTGGIFLGGLAMAIKFIEKQIERLEEKQDKHNGLIERMVRVESSSKSAHKRINRITGETEE